MKLLVVWAMIGHVSARTVLNASNPVSFFTTVADKMLRNTFNFGVTNIPVYTNGTLVYSPAVQRILQLSANVYDATTTNFYPSVFRPIFEYDAAGNVLIVGYTNLTSVSGLNTVSGANDPQLSAPWDLASLTNVGTSNTPILQNVYGVPWIIGAKKGFPAFNKFGMQTIVQVSRKLQVQRSSFPTMIGSTSFLTNQLLSFSISNIINAECWNSYSNTYPNPVAIFALDTLSMRITNDAGAPDQSFNHSQLSSTLTVTAWPGYNNVAPALSFTNPISDSAILLSNADFYFGSAPPGVSGFYPDMAGYGWESNKFDFPFPHFSLLTTNRLQLYMLDFSSGVHVIDYVHFAGPETALDITTTIESNNPPVIGYGVNMWSQAVDANGVPFGIKNQILESELPIGGNNGALYWQPNAVNEKGIDMFANFMGLISPYGSDQSDNTNYFFQVPYVPIATISQYTSWQVNDPLVHYLASDLNYFGTEVGSQLQTGVQVWYGKAGDVVPNPTYKMVNDRYQPWGMAAPIRYKTANYNFLNPYNLIYKDPLVWSADYWSFPTNLLSSLAGLGQVHRGTPWQTIYLKAGEVLQAGGIPGAGTNTWMAWTGDYNPADAAITVPVNDRPLVSLLIALLNTNDVTQLVSVNDPNPSDWLNTLNGLTVYSNSILMPPFAFRGLIPPAFDTYLMASNSPQAQIIANGIAQARALLPHQTFNLTGDILAIPTLTENSPWLNLSNTNLQYYGITDAAYEAVPAQLLLLLRPDSIGTVASTAGGWNLQFSGSDAFSYALQTSTDMVSWTTVSTNQPVGGYFTIPLPAQPILQKQFYRSVLLP